jgi:hypothetical protein
MIDLVVWGTLELSERSDDNGSRKRAITPFGGWRSSFLGAALARGVRLWGMGDLKEQAPDQVKRSGRFVPGTSGNPAGRPRGSRDAKTVALAELVDGSGEAVVRKLCASAEAGAPWAIRMVVEKILPRMERRVDVELPEVETAAQVGLAIARVIALAAEGSLTIEEAKAFLQLLEVQRRAIETSDLAVRLELLEQQQKEY